VFNAAIDFRLFLNYCFLKHNKKNNLMNNEQLSRFTLLTKKVIDTNASLSELNEYKGLLNTLNELVALSPLQAIDNFKNYNLSAEDQG